MGAHQLCSTTEGMTASKVLTGSLPLPSSTIWKLPLMVPALRHRPISSVCESQPGSPGQLSVHEPRSRVRRAVHALALQIRGVRFKD